MPCHKRNMNFLWTMMRPYKIGGDVYFIMELAPNTDPNELRSKLELIALGTDKIGYANYMPNIGYMVCVTNLGIYETLLTLGSRLI